MACHQLLAVILLTDEVAEPHLLWDYGLYTSLLERSIIKGENPVSDTDYQGFVVCSQRVKLFGNAAQNGW